MKGAVLVCVVVVTLSLACHGNNMLGQLSVFVFVFVRALRASILSMRKYRHLVYVSQLPNISARFFYFFFSGIVPGIRQKNVGLSWTKSGSEHTVWNHRNLLPYLVLLAVVSTIIFTLELRTIAIKGSSLNTFSTISASQHLAPPTSRTTRRTATYTQTGTESTSHDSLTAITRATNILSNQTKDLTTFAEPKQTRVIIVAYFRSGSTFLGELLSWIPDTYYSFEPLRQFSRNERLSQKQVPRAFQIISDIISCDFSNSSDYLASLGNWNYSLQENRLLWSRCSKALNVCVDPQFITAVCSNASFWVMKLTRVTVRDVHQWMRMNKDVADTVKVVHLVRDPRGILQSRKRLEWCKATCILVKSLCEEMRGDINAFEDLVRDFPGNAVRLKYEDFVQNLPTSAEELFSQLGQSFTEDVRTFIKTRSSGLTIEDLSNPHSTKRNASQSASQWRYRLRVPDIVAVQDACYDVIHRLGYQMLEDV